MKILLRLLIVAIASAGVTYLLVGLRESGAAVESGADLAWIRTEFGLDEDQFDRVRALHGEYSGQCAQHCADIMDAQRQLRELEAGGASEAEREAMRRRLAALEEVCNQATREHLRRVAAVMPAGQGERFLRTVEPHLADSPHDGSRGLVR